MNKRIVLWEFWNTSLDETKAHANVENVLFSIIYN